MNISGVVTTARRSVAISGRLGAPGAIDQGRRSEDPRILLFLRFACGGSDQADLADARRLNQLRPRSTFF